MVAPCPSRSRPTPTPQPARRQPVAARFDHRRLVPCRRRGLCLGRVVSPSRRGSDPTRKRLASRLVALSDHGPRGGRPLRCCSTRPGRSERAPTGKVGMASLPSRRRTTPRGRLAWPSRLQRGPPHQPRPCRVHPPRRSPRRRSPERLNAGCRRPRATDGHENVTATVEGSCQPGSAGASPSADDRGACALVHPMGLGDLHLLDTSRSQFCLICHATSETNSGAVGCPTAVTNLSGCPVPSSRFTGGFGRSRWCPPPRALCVSVPLTATSSTRRP